MSKNKSPSWEQWAQDMVVAESEGERLRADGWFTIQDFCAKTNMGLDRGRLLLRRMAKNKELRWRQAYALTPDNRMMRLMFYHLP